MIENIFSKQEFRCIFLLSEGLTSKEIGRSMSLSPRTVEEYLCNAKRKVHITRSGKLISYFVRHLTLEGELADVYRDYRV